MRNPTSAISHAARHVLGKGGRSTSATGISTTSTALFALLANSNARGGGDFPAHELIGRWAGDRILIQGDYAGPGDNAYTDPEQLDAFTDISSQVLEMLRVIESKY